MALLGWIGWKGTFFQCRVIGDITITTLIQGIVKCIDYRYLNILYITSLPPHPSLIQLKTVNIDPSRKQKIVNVNFYYFFILNSKPV